eukprot:TRINITY_DN18807_c0_g1_i1.p2 TRINITY_DN18807_c0_g1~~TRINITY_DN18807_c0_g1_i1.p2  ORF type:complete len:124 (-),score=11.18 TRINITY_DN18807_c0_g1_i1:332-703(-)
MKLQQRDDSTSAYGKTCFRDKNLLCTIPYNESDTSAATLTAKVQRSKSRGYNFAPYRIRMRRNFRTPVKSIYSGSAKKAGKDYVEVKDTFYVERKENEKHLRVSLCCTVVEHCKVSGVQAEKR